MSAPKLATPGWRQSTVAVVTLTAYHEAGHAVLSAAINEKPRHVSIRPEGQTLGRSKALMTAPPSSLAQVHLAGFAAEHLLVRRRPRDLDREISFAILAHDDRALLDAFAGSEERDGYRAIQEVLASGIGRTDEAIRREVDRLYEVARESLITAWPAVKAVAKALVKHQELDRDGLNEAIGDFDIDSSVACVQRAHGLLPGPTDDQRAGYGRHARELRFQARALLDRTIGTQRAGTAPVPQGIDGPNMGRHRELVDRSRSKHRLVVSARGQQVLVAEDPHEIAVAVRTLGEVEVTDPGSFIAPATGARKRHVRAAAARKCEGLAVVTVDDLIDREPIPRRRAGRGQIAHDRKSGCRE